MTDIVTAYQPRYYPRLHYLARAQAADIFIIYDDVQLSRGSAQHRAPIEYYDQSGLTIPIRHTGLDTPINEARIDMSEPWPWRHLQTLVGKYGEEAAELRPFYERLCPSVVRPEVLRENPDEITERMPDASSGDRLADWLECDAQWRKRQQELERLQARKREIGEEIARLKREDPEATINELVADAEDVSSQLSSVEESCRELKERRDRELVAISATIGGDASVDSLPLNRRWDLEGVDIGSVRESTRLVDLTVPLLEELVHRFDVTACLVRSSTIPVEPRDDASAYLAELTEFVGGDSYLSGGVGYENYLDEDPFDARGLDVLVQDWVPSWDDGNVCALDVLYGSDDPAAHVR